MNSDKKTFLSADRKYVVIKRILIDIKYLQVEVHFFKSWIPQIITDFEKFKRNVSSTYMIMENLNERYIS